MTPMRPVPMTPAVLPARSNPTRPSSEKLPSRHAVVRPMDVPVERQDQRQRVLGHRIRRVRRHPHHGDAVVASRDEIDVVETGAAQRDAPGAAGCELGDHRCRQVVVDERAHGDGAGRELDGLQVESGFEVYQVDARSGHGGVERAPLVRLGREDPQPRQRAHGCRP